MTHIYRYKPDHFNPVILIHYCLTDLEFVKLIGMCVFLSGMFEDESNSRPYLEDLPKEMAESSAKTRMSQWKRYLEFCPIYWAHPLPAEPHLICMYIDHLEELQRSTIWNYVGGVTLLHKLKGFDTKFMRDPDVRSKLGIKRFQGRSTDNR